MSIEYKLINRKTHSLLCMGRCWEIWEYAQTDLAWVTDRALLQVVMEEAYADFRWESNPGLDRERYLKNLADGIWKFVEGASPKDIEFTWDAEYEDLDLLQSFKTSQLY